MGWVKRLKDIGKDPDDADERKALEEYSALLDQQADTKARLKTAQEDLEAKLDAQYPKLTEDDIKTLVVDDKWLGTLAAAVNGYATPLPQLTIEVAALAARVDERLKRMGFQP